MAALASQALTEAPTEQLDLPASSNDPVANPTGAIPGQYQSVRDFVPLSDEIKPTQEIGAGFRRGLNTLQAGAYGALSALGDAIDGNDQETHNSLANWMRRTGDEGFDRNMQQAAQDPANVEFRDAIEGDGSLLRWALGALGESAPSLLMMSGTGGAGAVLGVGAKAVANKLGANMLKNKVRQEAMRRYGKDFAGGKAVADRFMANLPRYNKALQNAPTVGAATGAFVGSGAVESGGIFKEAEQKWGTRDPATAFAAGGLGAAFEVAGAGVLFKMFGKGMTDSVKAGLVETMLKRAGIGVGSEGFTEAVQESINVLAVESQNPDKSVPLLERIQTEDVAWQIASAAAAGGLFGGTLGASGGLVSGLMNRKPAEDTPPADPTTATTADIPPAANEPAVVRSKSSTITPLSAEAVGPDGSPVLVDNTPKTLNDMARGQTLLSKGAENFDEPTTVPTNDRPTGGEPTTPRIATPVNKGPVAEEEGGGVSTPSEPELAGTPAATDGGTEGDTSPPLLPETEGQLDGQADSQADEGVEAGQGGSEGGTRRADSGDGGRDDVTVPDITTEPEHRPDSTTGQTDQQPTEGTKETEDSGTKAPEGTEGSTDGNQGDTPPTDRPGVPTSPTELPDSDGKKKGARFTKRPAKSGTSTSKPSTVRSAESRKRKRKEAFQKLTDARNQRAFEATFEDGAIEIELKKLVTSDNKVSKHNDPAKHPKGVKDLARRLAKMTNLSGRAISEEFGISKRLGIRISKELKGNEKAIAAAKVASDFVEPVRWQKPRTVEHKPRAKGPEPLGSLISDNTTESDKAKIKALTGVRKNLAIKAAKFIDSNEKLTPTQKVKIKSGIAKLATAGRSLKDTKNLVDSFVARTTTSNPDLPASAVNARPADVNTEAAMPIKAVLRIDKGDPIEATPEQVAMADKFVEELGEIRGKFGSKSTGLDIEQTQKELMILNFVVESSTSKTKGLSSPAMANAQKRADEQKIINALLAEKNRTATVTKKTKGPVTTVDLKKKPARELTLEEAELELDAGNLQEALLVNKPIQQLVQSINSGKFQELDGDTKEQRLEEAFRFLFDRDVTEEAWTTNLKHLQKLIEINEAAVFNSETKMSKELSDQEAIFHAGLTEIGRHGPVTTRHGSSIKFEEGNDRSIQGWKAATDAQKDQLYDREPSYTNEKLEQALEGVRKDNKLSLGPSSVEFGMAEGFDQNLMDLEQQLLLKIDSIRTNREVNYEHGGQLYLIFEDGQYFIEEAFDGLSMEQSWVFSDRHQEYRPFSDVAQEMIDHTLQKGIALTRIEPKKRPEALKKYAIKMNALNSENVVADVRRITNLGRRLGQYIGADPQSALENFHAGLDILAHHPESYRMVDKTDLDQKVIGFVREDRYTTPSEKELAKATYGTLRAEAGVKYDVLRHQSATLQSRLTTIRNSLSRIVNFDGMAIAPDGNLVAVDDVRKQKALVWKRINAMGVAATNLKNGLKKRKNIHLSAQAARVVNDVKKLKELIKAGNKDAVLKHVTETMDLHVRTLDNVVQDFSRDTALDKIFKLMDKQAKLTKAIGEASPTEVIEVKDEEGNVIDKIRKKEKLKQELKEVESVLVKQYSGAYELGMDAHNDLAGGVQEMGSEDYDGSDRFKTLKEELDDPGPLTGQKVTKKTELPKPYQLSERPTGVIAGGLRNEKVRETIENLHKLFPRFNIMLRDNVDVGVMLRRMDNLSTSQMNFVELFKQKRAEGNQAAVFFDDETMHLWFDDKISSKDAETFAAHEFGHVIYRQFLQDHMSGVNRKGEEVTGGRTAMGKAIIKAFHDSGSTVSLEEWFADGVAYWYKKSGGKPASMLERAFKTVADFIKSIYMQATGVQQQYGSVEAFMDGLTSRQNDVVRRRMRSALLDKSLARVPGYDHEMYELAARTEMWGTNIEPDLAFAMDGAILNKANTWLDKNKAGSYLKYQVTAGVELSVQIGKWIGDNVLKSADGYLRSQTNAKGERITALDVMADMFYRREGEVRKKSATVKGLGGLTYTFNIPEEAFLDSVRRVQSVWAQGKQKGNRGYEDVLKSLENFTQAEMDQLLKIAQSNGVGLDQAPEKVKKAYRATRQVLDRFHGQYLSEKFPQIAKVKNFFPRVYDVSKILTKKIEFTETIKRHLADWTIEDTEILVDKMQKSAGFLDADDISTLAAPASASKRQRQFKDIPDAALEPFFQKDFMGIMRTYFHQMVRRGEYQGRGGATEVTVHNPKTGLTKTEISPSITDFLLEAAAVQGATRKQITQTKKIHEAYLGRLGADLDPFMRSTLSTIQTYQNVRLLPMAVLSSLVDIANPYIRSRGSVGIVESMKNLRKAFKAHKLAGGNLYDMAATHGLISDKVAAESMNERINSPYMSEGAQKVNEKFFRLIWLQQFTNVSRMYAAETAKTFLVQHATKPTKHSKRYLEELGVTPQQVKQWNKDGRKTWLVDDNASPTDQAVQLAINNFVQSSVFLPNAAQRPAWASDPKWMLVWHLKQFMWSIGKVVIQGAWREAKHRPEMKDKLMVALPFLAMLPLAMLGMEIRDWMKYELMPWREGEPPWQADSWGEYSFDAVRRTGMFGPLDVLLSANDTANWGGFAVLSLFGPTAMQFNDFVTDPFSTSIPKALPVTSILPEERALTREILFGD